MPHLEIKLCDGRTEEIAGKGELDKQLQQFLTQTGPYASAWVALISGEHIRYDQIVSVKIVN